MAEPPSLITERGRPRFMNGAVAPRNDERTIADQRVSDVPGLDMLLGLIEEDPAEILFPSFVLEQNELDHVVFLGA